MPLVNTKSPIVINYDAIPRILTPSYIAGSPEATGTGIVSIAFSDSPWSTYPVAVISSSVVLKSLSIVNDALPLVTVRFGIVNTTQNGAGLVGLYSDWIFAAGPIDLTTARPIMTNILAPTIQNGPVLAANAGLRVWELLGLTADPQCDYNLIMTRTEIAANATGNVAVRYTWLR